MRLSNVERVNIPLASTASETRVKDLRQTSNVRPGLAIRLSSETRSGYDMLNAAKRWVGGWQRAIEAAKRHDVRDFHRLEIDGPATMAEVSEVECAIARRLPEPFRKTLLEFSRRVDFFWALPQHVRPPKPLIGRVFSEHAPGTSGD